MCMYESVLVCICMYHFVSALYLFKFNAFVSASIYLCICMYVLYLHVYTLYLLVSACINRNICLGIR